MSRTFLVKIFRVLALLRTWRDNCQGEISEKSGGEKYVGRTCRFAASPEVSPGATIGIL
jgi:hypothetical protein